jgi:hypothetical protein
LFVSTPLGNPNTGIVNANGSTTEALTNANDHIFAVSGEGFELLKFFDNSSGFTDVAEMISKVANALDKFDRFAELVNDEYVIDLPSVYPFNSTDDDKFGLYANVAVADIALGVHNYKIVKTYPDGRVITIADTVEVTDLDLNQIAIFGSSTKANNTKFVDNWRIAELAADFELGTYTFEFTIATVTRTFTVNIIDRPSLEVVNLTVGTGQALLYGKVYTVNPIVNGAVNDTVVLEFDLNNLPSDAFVSAVISGGNSAQLEINTLLSGGATANSTAKVDLSTLADNKLLIGKIRTTALATTDDITITLYFWEKVDYSVSTARFIQIGEPQVILMGALAPIA